MIIFNPDFKKVYVKVVNFYFCHILANRKKRAMASFGVR